MKDCLKKVNRILESEADPAFARRAKIIFENLELSGKEKVLEVGCGRGFYVKTLKEVWPGLQVTGVDLNPKYLEQAKEFKGDLRVELRVADATDLPFADDTFDRIIASEVLEHIPNDEKAISEIFRVLKPGGIVMITVPNKNYPFCWDPANWVLERTFHWHLPSNIWWLAGIWADHERLYDERELRSKMEKAGFGVEKVWHVTHYCLPFSHFLFYGIGKNLVEKGMLPEINRFSGQKTDSFLKKILLWPIKKVDSLNRTTQNSKSSMNIIMLVKKL